MEKIGGSNPLGTTKIMNIRFRLWLEWKLLTSAGRKEVRSLVKPVLFARAYGAEDQKLPYWVTRRVLDRIGYKGRHDL
jgi:hypothetical protein